MKNSIPIQLLLIITLSISFTDLYSQIGSWINVNNLPNEQGFSASTVLDNKIYIIGGFVDDDAPAIQDVIAYDPLLDSFILNIADLPVPLGRVEAETLNGKIYAVGGHSINWGDNMLPSVYEYDPQNNSWTQKADMLQPRFNHSTTVLGDKLVAVAGRTVAYPADVDNTVEIYDPQTDTWSSLPPMNNIRAGHIAEVVNGKLYVIAGAIPPNNSPAVEMYNPGTNQWTNLTEIPNRWGHGSVVLDDQIYFFGGADYVKALPGIWRYNTANDTLIDLGALMPDTIGYSAHGLLEDAFGDQCIYVLGGTTDDWWIGGNGPTTTDKVLKFCPESLSVSILGAAAVAGLKYKVLPNPLTDEAQINYALEDGSNVEIVILDQTGRLIARIFSGFQYKGPYIFIWNAKEIPAGIYYCKIKTDKFIGTQKMIIQH